MYDHCVYTSIDLAVDATDDQPVRERVVLAQVLPASTAQHVMQYGAVVVVSLPSAHRKSGARARVSVRCKPSRYLHRTRLRARRPESACWLPLRALNFTRESNSTDGIRNAIVLPAPVRAAPRRSLQACYQSQHRQE